MKKENFAIFPTLVSAFDLKGHSQEQTCIDIIEQHNNLTDHALIKGGKSSFVVGDEQFLFDKRLEKLRWDIQGCIDSYCDDAGLEPSLLCTSWFNVMGEGSNVERHRHEGSVVSGAYYPLVEDESCPLIFESPLRQVRMCDVFDKQNEFSSYYVSMKPKNGLLLIFPSWLEHRTDPNASGKRITVSFNTIRKNLVPHIIAQQKHYGKFPVDNQPRV